jgi:hypothetical protein
MDLMFATHAQGERLAWIEGMGRNDKRTSERWKVCVQVFASDLEDGLDVKCIVRDVSKSGCKIVSNRLNDLPDLVQLIPEGFDKPIRGKIVWRERNMAGVCFEHACGDVRAAIQEFRSALKNEESEDVLHLGDEHEALSYSDRLKRYRPVR